MTEIVLRRGDLIKLPDGTSYAIGELRAFDYSPGSTASFQHMTTLTVEIWRNPDPDSVTKKRGAPEKVYDGVKCTPIDTLHRDLQENNNFPVTLQTTLIDAGARFYGATLEKRETV